MVEVLEVLRWQHKVAWSYAERFLLPRLTDESCLWLPNANGVPVRQGPDGRWIADWSDVEPDPVPVAWVAWLTWHLQWWWSQAIAATTDQALPDRESIHWPGTAESVRDSLNELAVRWSEILDTTNAAELDNPRSYPVDAVQPRWRLFVGSTSS